MVCRFFTLLAIGENEERRVVYVCFFANLFAAVLLWPFVVPNAMSWASMLPESTDVGRLTSDTLLGNFLCFVVFEVCFAVCFVLGLSGHRTWCESCSLSHPLYLGSFLLNADIRLVRLEYLQELVDEGYALPRRQEAEHATVKSTGQTALVSHAEMLASLPKCSGCGNGSRRQMPKSKPLGLNPNPRH